MQEVLEHLAQTLLLEAFLEVLPGPPSSEDFQVQQKPLIVIIGAIQSPIHYKKLLCDNLNFFWPYRKITRLRIVMYLKTMKYACKYALKNVKICI
jgi:hypothetical protein